MKQIPGFVGRASSAYLVWQDGRAGVLVDAGAARKLHAPASVIGQVAEKSNVETLVLSHFMSRSLNDLDNSLAKIRLKFTGDIILAEDLQCIGLGKYLK